MRLLPRAIGLLLLAPFLTALPAAAGDGRVSTVYHLGGVDPRAAHEQVREALSADGRAVLDEGHNTLIVLDVPEKQAAAREVLNRLQGDRPKIRVDFRIVGRESGTEAEVGSSGQLLLALPPSANRAAVHFDVDEKHSGNTRSSTQSVVVADGGEGTFAIGRNIPYQSWLEEYGRRRNVITGTTEWKEVGSHLTVRPSIVDGGRNIRLEAVPGLSYLAGRRRGTVAFATAAAEAVVPSGGEVRLGGDGEEGDGFFSRFLVGYDRQRRVRQVDVFLRATVTSLR